MKNLIFILVLCTFSIVGSIAQQESNIVKENLELSPETIEIIDNSSFSEADTGAVILFREAKMIVDDDGLRTISYHIIGQILTRKQKKIIVRFQYRLIVIMIV